MGSNVKKARVSWPSDSMLCQVKMFQKEDYPAKVGAQTCSKSKASKDLHHGTFYSTRPNIPLITWKPPPKFILTDHWLAASGEESTETGSENLRIAKVLEAFYPHRSLIPSRPSISPAAVQVDDTNTPTIRLTPIEEEDDDQLESPALQSSQSSKTTPSLFGHGPDLTLAALSALLNTNEQGSMVDADLLVKFLTDPIIINNLLNAAATKPLETGNNNNTTKPPHQHVTTSSANSPPGNGVTPFLTAAQSIVTHVPTQPMAPLVLNTHPLSCALKPLPRVEESLEPSSVVVSEPQNQSSPTSGTWNMSRVLESAGTVTDTQSAYQMNITRDDYFKNLIREHGGVFAPATNKYKRRVANNNNNNNNDEKKALVKSKGQKPCMFFGEGKGCKLGESCLYLHDPSKRLSTYDVAAAPRAKRLKFRT